jgi:phosphate/sulfate permease
MEQPVLKEENNQVTGQSNQLLALIFGIGGAVLGAVVWYLVTAFSGYQVGYIAILVGFFVGYGMKMGLKDKNSFLMGIVAAFLSLFGILLGNGLLWYFQSPKWAKEAFPELTNVTDAQLRSDFSLIDYLKEDINVAEYGRDAALGILFYALAIFVAFNAVCNLREIFKK